MSTQRRETLKRECGCEIESYLGAIRVKVKSCYAHGGPPVQVTDCRGGFIDASGELQKRDHIR